LKNVFKKGFKIFTKHFQKKFQQFFQKISKKSFEFCPKFFAKQNFETGSKLFQKCFVREKN
jgi:hypothetical protein